MNEMEMAARRLNDADSGIRRAVAVYLDLGWSAEEFLERVEEIADEEGLPAEGAAADHDYVDERRPRR